MTRETLAQRRARLRALAELVFESRTDAMDFLKSPHPLLDGQSPEHVARTVAGAHRVEEILNRLEYSLPV